MTGMEEKAPVIGDWMPMDPSPRTLFSNFLADDFSSRPLPNLLAYSGNEDALAEVEMPKMVPDANEKDGDRGNDLDDPFFEANAFSVPKPGIRGGLAQRMAARTGFNAPKLNTARIRSTNMSSSPLEVRSPYLTIPPGLSPTTLLDSPIFLSNSLVQPSPTTGKFVLNQSSNRVSVSVTGISERVQENHFAEVDTGSFMFKLHPESSSAYFLNTETKVAPSMDRQQLLPSAKLSVHPVLPNNESQDAICPRSSQDFDLKSDKDTTDDFTFEQNASDSAIGDEPLDGQQDGEGESKGESSSVGISAPSEDGFNWRKYGQKQVKGSEYPRSYYKCTHPNCQVKKKVERSHDGHITEIIYKGAHNHPKPPPNRRSAIPASQPFNEMSIDGSEFHACQPVLDGKLIWASQRVGNVGLDRKNDGLEVISSATISAKLCDPSPIQAQDGHCFESTDTIDILSSISNDEDEDDRATHGSVSLGCDGEGDESESKRRKVDTSPMDTSAASRAVREPRVVVQTTSEVDILDDGYRWRKYGQKVVKGNPNPRSYYKCTYPGCMVRKHVERASHDLKSVITTYEGKHNHDVPAARNSSHASAGPSGAAATSVSHSHSAHRRPDPQDNHPTFNALPPLSSFALQGREQLGTSHSFSFGAGHHGLAILPMAGLGPASQMKTLATSRPYMGLHHVNEAGLMMPKGEPKEEPASETSLSVPNGPAVYQQIMSRMPLGPQL